MNIQNVIDYSKEQIERSEEIRFHHMEEFVAEKARNPILVVYAGRKAAENMHDAVHRQIARIWTPYRNIIPFCIIKESGEGDAAFSGLDGSEWTQEILNGTLNNLFSDAQHYMGYRHLNVYYILDTTPLATAEDVKKQMDLIIASKERIPSGEQRTAVLLLLDESMGREQFALSVKNLLASECFSDEGYPEFVRSIDKLFIVGNRSSSGEVMSGHQDWGRIVGDLIALTSREDGQNIGILQSSGIKTVGFAVEKKPTASIATTVATKVFNEIGRELQRLPERAIDINAVRERLGAISGQGFEPIRQMVTMSVDLLPNEEHLQHFPRRDSNDHGILADMPVREFNELTLGAWNAFLDGIVAEVSRMMTGDSVQADQWKGWYRDYLNSRFSVYELIGVAQKRETLVNMFANSMIVADTEPVIRSLERSLAQRLLQNRNILDLLVDGIVEFGKNGSEGIRRWQETMTSMRDVVVGDVSGTNVEEYYGQLTREYFISKKEEIRRELDQADEEYEIEAMVCNACEGIISSNSIFGAAFEEEMSRRIGNQADLERVQDDVRRKLTGDNVKIWFSTTGAAIGNPGTEDSIVLVRPGSELNRYLKMHLEPGVHFFASQNGDSAETIQILNVEKRHLL